MKLKYPVTRFIVHTRTTLLRRLLSVILIAEAVAVDELTIPLLPDDENEAHRMLEEGTLDSAVWRKVEQFYTAPLCVSRGDVRILYDLFPTLSDAAPLDPARLARYEPWEAREQRRFFTDFPELVPYRPILSFESPHTYQVGGRAGFYYSRRGMFDTARQYALFALNGSLAEASGRIDFTDAYGRWYRRALMVKPTRRSKMIFGNFSPEKRERLFYGYFPSSPDTDSLSAENWRYGTIRSWNGVCAVLKRSDKDRTIFPGCEAFLHDRPTERIGAFDATFPLSNYVSYSAGTSALTTIDSAGRRNGSGYFHTGIAITAAPSWKTELRSGVDVRRPEIVPWYFSFNHRSQGFGCNGMLTFLPKGFNAPRGEIGRIVLDQCEMGDTARSDLVAADISFNHSIAAFFRYAPRLRCIFADDNVRDLTAAMEFRGKGRAEYRLSYSWSPDLRAMNHRPALHQEVLQWSYCFSQKLEFACTQTAVFTSDGYWRYRLRVSPGFQAGPALRIAPLLVLQDTRDRLAEKRIGIEKTLKFFNKTFSELTIEQSLPFSSLETIHAQGKMSFLF